MEITTIGRAGTLESNDVMITVDFTKDDGLIIEIESIVAAQFEEQIRAAIHEVLEDMRISKGHIQVVDKGALDFAIKARLKTAIKRAEGGNQS
ncbi:citrate lyase subunit gamma (acyl carrier protein) [Anaerovirgula multivorans]|uniref:Citrate lyase subunit gamma (Acyl carrier protein) n=1 Tax=Anaerovirgula multivorans TaxID=312168 RepID=A0A239K910_9FIRM|nr:citrate lyase acyl carrier protein [Anaerovirgula multivorans]SNT14152.1 citrate lyase subunit gamma (acyl carrier protein) [Anaerovirgula multivorans]